MSRRLFPLPDQVVELDKLVMLERFRRRNQMLPDDLIEEGLTTAASKRVARALDGKIARADLDERELRYVKQVETSA